MGKTFKDNKYRKFDRPKKGKHNKPVIQNHGNGQPEREPYYYGIEDGRRI